MGIQKKLIYLGIFFALVVSIYLLFSTGDQSEKEKLNAEDFSFLLGGSGGSSSNSGKSGNPMGYRGENSQSVFDSDFYSSGKFTYEDPNSSTSSNSTQGDIPINPQTGKPYPEEAMKQFERLREYFPDNDLIPRRLTPELKEKQIRETEKISEVSRRVLGGNPNREDLDYYYGNLEKQTNDRLEIIEYLIDTQGGGSDEMDKKFKEVLDGIKFQKSQLLEEKANAYKRTGN